MMQSLQETLTFLFLHPLSLSFLLFLLSISISIWAIRKSAPKKNLPPSPPRLPIIGNLHQLGMYPYHSLRTLSQKYGDLMLLRLGSKPTIIVSSAEVASQVLKTHDLIFANRPHLSVLKRLIGNGNDILLSSYGEYWRQLRSICALQLLSITRVKSFRSVRKEEAALMEGKIRGLSIVNLTQMLMTLNTDVMCRVAFGKKYGGVGEGGIDFYVLLDGIRKLLGGFYIQDYVSWLGWIDRINGVDAKVNQVTSGFDRFFERILEEHSVARRSESDGDKQNGMAMKDFVDVLLEVQREDDGSGNFCLDKESIKTLILDMFAGGSDTTYITQEWVMAELLRNPRVMKELQKEVRGITGDKEGVSEDDLDKMKYLKAVIKETLRLHPPIPLTPPHLSTEDVKLNGYDIASGTMLIVNIWAISRDPKYWEEPESFYPERFMNSPIDFKGKDFQFITFGSGRRSCPGMAFATATIEFAIANLVHQFDWALPNGTTEESLDMTESPGIAVRKKTPLLAIPTPRIY